MKIRITKEELDNASKGVGVCRFHHHLVAKNVLKEKGLSCPMYFCPVMERKEPLWLRHMGKGWYSL